MPIRLILLSLSFIFAIGSFSQKDCFTEIIDQKITESDLEEANNERFLNNINCFLGHGLDETDLKIFTIDQTMIGMMVQMLIKEGGDQLTYKKLHEQMVNLVQSESFQTNKTMISSVIDFFRLPADINNWDKDKQLLLKAGATEEEANEFYVFLKEHGDPAITYKDVFDEFSVSRNSTQGSEEEILLFAPYENFNLEEILVFSVEEGYPIVFYFSSADCGPCNALEDQIQIDDLIYSRLYEECIFVTLHCDDTSALAPTDQYFSKILQRKVITIGDQVKKFQLSFFNTSTIPSMFAIDSDKTIIATLPLIKDPQEIHEFLNKMNEVYYGEIESVEEEPQGE